MKTLIIILLIAIALFCFAEFIDLGIKVFDVAWRRYEGVECLDWQSQSQTYENWYATDWQKEQCEQFGIDL